MTPTPDHVWLRSILLDPSPATFAAWSDWLREQERYEEAEIAAQGRVPIVDPKSLVWYCCLGDFRKWRGSNSLGVDDVLHFVFVAGESSHNAQLAAEARWVLEGGAPANRGG